MPKPHIETNDIEVLRAQFIAWREGVAARLVGIDCHYNPHPSRTTKGDAWENAWEFVDHLIDKPNEQ